MICPPWFHVFEYLVPSGSSVWGDRGLLEEVRHRRHMCEHTCVEQRSSLDVVPQAPPRLLLSLFFNLNFLLDVFMCGWVDGKQIDG